MEKYTINHAFYVFRNVVILTDFLLMGAASLIAYWLVNGYTASLNDPFLSFVTIMSLSWITIGSFSKYYQPTQVFALREVIESFPFVVMGHIAVISLYISMFKLHSFPTEFYFLAYTFGVGLILLFRLFASRLYKYRRVLFRNYKVVIVGSGASASALYSFFNSKMTKVYKFWDFTDSSSGDSFDQTSMEERIDELKQFCLQENVSEIYFTLPITSKSFIEEMADFADNNYMYFRIANDFNLLNNREVTVHFYDQMPIITLKKDPLASLAKRTAKRIFDFFFSAFVTVFVLLPVFLVVGFLIKIESPGPIIFTQERAGRKNRRFKCFKFRTMRTPKKGEKAVFKQATKADPRVTRVGAFLRKTSLDELPQFFNVLLGDMSVVGPRPHPIPLDGMFAPKIHKYQYRYFIKPGITGPAQINGFRGETRTPYEMEKRVEYDTWYIENWSLFLDIKLIFATVFNVFKGEENAY